jgi:hypothetical protein
VWPDAFFRGCNALEYNLGTGWVEALLIARAGGAQDAQNILPGTSMFEPIWPQRTVQGWKCTRSVKITALFLV